MTTTPMIEVKDLTVIYNENSPNEVVALKDFSLTVNKGEILVITGDNGSGKSTILRAITGVIPIKSGKIILNGIDVTKWSSNKRAKLIGMVHQDTMLGTCPNLTIQENFQLAGSSQWWQLLPYNLKLNKQQIKNIKRTGLPLDNRDNTKINMLSGGQRQAIAVCLAFENQKNILLFDEFTSALDENTSNNVLSFSLDYAKQRSITLILISHNEKIINKYNLSSIRIQL